MADAAHAGAAAPSFSLTGIVGRTGPGTVLPAPVVKRPAHHAPAGHPIPLSSGLRYDQLLEFIVQRPSLSILEIGVARGANTLRMLAFADYLGGRPRYTGVDLFGLITDNLIEASYCSESKRPQTVEATMAHFQTQLGDAIAERIELYEGFSHDVLPALIDGQRKFDLIFIDGGHSDAAVASDWRDCQSLLAPFGAIVFDDYPNWGIGTTVARIDANRWQVNVLPHRDTFQNHRLDEDPSPVRHHQLVAVRRRPG